MTKLKNITVADIQNMSEDERRALSARLDSSAQQKHETILFQRQQDATVAHTLDVVVARAIDMANQLLGDIEARNPQAKTERARALLALKPVDMLAALTQDTLRDLSMDMAGQEVSASAFPSDIQDMLQSGKDRMESPRGASKQTYEQEAARYFDRVEKTLPFIGATLVNTNPLAPLPAPIYPNADVEDYAAQDDMQMSMDLLRRDLLINAIPFYAADALALAKNCAATATNGDKQ